MKPIFILALAVLTVFFTNCDPYTTCDETTFDLGEVLLEDSTKNLFYQNDDILVFKNAANNNELRFNPTSNQNIMIPLERIKPCENFHISYSVQSINQTFTSENSLIQIFISARPWYTLLLSPIVSPFDDLGFYDNFFTGITISSTQDTSGIRLMAAYKNQKIQHSYLVTVADYFDKSQNQTTINGIIYNDVYADLNNNGMHYYFSKEQRIIAFRNPNDNSLWVFDRIE